MVSPPSAGRLAWLTGRRFDLLVIGGGINGAGIAREAARRGLSVALVEKLDYAAGTTSRATRLIHGGVRYLEHGELVLVLESLREREALLRRAPHLVRPLPFLIPVFENSTRSPLFIRAGMVLYDLLSAGKSLPRHRFLDPGGMRRLEAQLALPGLKGAFLYYDAQVNYPERLTVETIQSARAAGAATLNHCEVLEFLIREDRVAGARVRDCLDGAEATVEAALTMNASGPWVEELDARLGKRSRSARPLLSPTSGTHLVVRPFPGAPKRALYFEARRDRRPVFIIPWDGLFLIGTTEVAFSGSPDGVRPTREEIRYLFEEAFEAMPQARLAAGDILYTYAGVRPLPHSSDATLAELTRRHLVYDHEKHEGVAGLASIIGGKLTTYRQLSRDAVDFALKKLERIPHYRERKWLRRAPEEDLPFFALWDWTASAEALEKEAAPLGEQYGAAPAEVVRLLATYGPGGQRILEMWRERPEWRRPLCEHTRVTEAEVLYTVREEQAITPADVLLRRTCVALGACRGLDAVPTVARLMNAPPEPALEEIERTLLRA